MFNATELAIDGFVKDLYNCYKSVYGNLEPDFPEIILVIAVLGTVFGIQAFPALGVERAARRIGWAVVKRPVRVAPRWTTFLEVLHAVVPGLLQWVFTHGHEGFHRMMGRRLKRMDARKRDPRS